MDEFVFADKYRVTETLDESAIADTYRALAEDGRDVVIRVFHAADDDAVARLEELARASQGMGHPHIARLLEWGRSGTDVHFVREYVPGKDMASLLADHGPPPVGSAVRYAMQVCSALTMAHRRGVVHGSLSAKHVFVDDKDSVKVTGFGSAPARGAAAVGPDTPPEDARGTSPEQLEGGEATQASDVWAVGTLLYELLTGNAPFDGDSAAAISERVKAGAPEPPSRTRPECPAALDAVVLRALEPAPASRFASPDEMRDALDKAQKEVMEAPKRKRRAWPWMLVLLILLLSTVGTAAAAWYMGLVSLNVRVPSLVGLTAEEAETALEDAGLRLGRASYTGEAVPGVADGSVSTQSPAPGELVGEGMVVDIGLAGEELVDMPKVIGQTEAQAVATLSTLGLKVTQVVSAYDAKVEPGRIVSQSPEPGESAAKGSDVTLTVSKGQKTAAVPSVTGMPQLEAQQALQKAGFKVLVRTEPSDAVPAGDVISQQPDAGLNANAGSNVTIVVSEGVRTVQVPAVTGMLAADAVLALHDAGLEVRVNYVTDPVSIGKVKQQSPTVGTTLQAGGTVTITVGQ